MTTTISTQEPIGRFTVPAHGRLIFIDRRERRSFDLPGFIEMTLQIGKRRRRTYRLLIFASYALATIGLTYVAVAGGAL